MRKYLSFLLVAVLVLSQFTVLADTVTGTVYSDETAPGVNKPVTEIEEELADAGVQDVKPTDWFAGSVTVLLEQGLLKPDAYGNVAPTATLDAGTGGAIFAKVLGVAQKDDTEEAALEAAKEVGLIPEAKEIDEPMTRVEVARMLAIALGVKSNPVAAPSQYPFSDYSAVTATDRGIIKALGELGLFKGYPDGTFQPNGVLTKAEISILVDRILGIGA